MQLNGRGSPPKITLKKASFSPFGGLHSLHVSSRLTLQMLISKNGGGKLPFWELAVGVWCSTT